MYTELLQDILDSLAFIGIFVGITLLVCLAILFVKIIHEIKRRD